MKLVVFGTGKLYQRYKSYFLKDNHRIIAFLDNNPDMWGKHMDGVQIYNPIDVMKMDFEMIILMSLKENEMYEQLLKIGIEENKLCFYEQFIALENKGKLFFYGDFPETAAKNKIVILSVALNYNGGTFAAIYAAMALQRKGYDVLLAAPDVNPVLKEEILQQGIRIAICPSLPYIQAEDIPWINECCAVIVNVFQMLQCACEVSKVKPVLWWIHEPKDLFPSIIAKCKEYAAVEKMMHIKIYAVAQIPKNNFNFYFGDVIKDTLAYGIPDVSLGKNKITVKEKIIFAIIGLVCERKAQINFVEAVKKLCDVDRKRAEFWIVGMIGDNEYSNTIRAMAAQCPDIKILGEYSRHEMEKAYSDIDVVVCPSLEDPLPIVMTEAMMYGKICVASDATGTADYIIDGINGFICRAGDADSLSQKMSWIINHKEDMPQIGKKARKIYEDNFSIESFGSRLEKAVNETILNYKRRDM